MSSADKGKSREINNTTNNYFGNNENTTLSHTRDGSLYSRNENSGRAHYGNRMDSNVLNSYPRGDFWRTTLARDSQATRNLRDDQGSPRANEMSSTRRPHNKRQRNSLEDHEDDDGSSPAEISNPGSYALRRTKSNPTWEMRNPRQPLGWGLSNQYENNIVLNRVKLNVKLEYETKHATWFVRGRVFRVTDEEWDTYIRGRTLVVIGPSWETSTCISLCGHSDMDGDENKWFFESHIPFHSADSMPVKRLCLDQWSSTEVKMHHGRELRPDTWANCESPWTIKHVVKVAAIGDVKGEELERLVQNFESIIRKMTRRQSVNPP